MKKLLVALLLLCCTALPAFAQSTITLPIAANAVADLGNGPIKARVISGNASIFTSQGSGVGSTSGSSTALTLTATPATPPIVGALISGTGITSGTTIAAYNGTTGITLSAAMTVAGGTTVSWGAACSSSAPANYIQASVSGGYYIMYTQARVCAVSPGGPVNTLLIEPVYGENVGGIITPGDGTMTRAQISTKTNLPSSIVVGGYRALNDLGYGASYTSTGCSSTGLEAIESADSVWFCLAPSGTINVGWFGAYGNGTVITSGDITANPQWRGTYSTGQTWDYVATQEAMYAAFAGGSTPGAIVWNLVTGGATKNLKLLIPNGVYSINAQIVTAASGFTIQFQQRAGAIWNWTGAADTTMWLCNSCSYGEIFNPSLENTAVQSYGSVAPIWSFDHTGSSPGGLLTQQLTIYDAFVSVSENGQGVAFNQVAGGSGQGDTVTWINPIFVGSFSDWAVQINGSNTIGMIFLHGDCQGFPHDCIQNNGGSFQIYGMHFENEAYSLGDHAPVENQIISFGGDLFSSSQNSGETSGVTYTRSEGDVLTNAFGAGISSGPQITNAKVLGADIGSWLANYSGFLEGNLVAAGTKGRTFVAVDNGGTPWGQITSSTSSSITDSTQSWSTNQWAGYNVALRFGSNGFTERCGITSNTATVLTIDCDPSTTSMYQVVGFTGGSAPNWDSAATGYTAPFSGSGQGVTTAAGSNQVGVGSSFYSDVTVGDYVLIPYADKLAPASGAAIFPMPLYAEVTAKSLTGCQGQVACLTISKNASAVVTNAAAYGGTPLTDNNISWINIPFDFVSSAPTINGLTGPGQIGYPNNITGYSPYRLDWVDPAFSFSGPSEQTILYAFGSQLGCFQPLTPGATIDLTVPLGECNVVTLTPTGNETLNFPLPQNQQTQKAVVFITTSGTTPYTITVGSNANTSFGTLSTGSVSGATFTMSFQSNGTVWQETGRSTTGGGSGNALFGTTTGNVAGDIVTMSNTTVGVQDSGVLLSSLAPKASPTFSGTVMMPDAGTWGSGGINGSNIGTTTPGTGAFTTLTASGVLRTSSAGSAAAPSLSVGNLTTGLYSVSTTGFGISVNGTNKLDYGITTANTWTTPATFRVNNLNGLQQINGNTSSLLVTQVGSAAGSLSSIFTDFQSTEGPLSLGTYTNRLSQVLMNVDGSVTFGTGPINVDGFAVASLPASPATGAVAYVTDQTTACPSLGGTFTGGGSVKCLAFYNGSSWTTPGSGYTLPVATASTLGGVKPDGTTILNSSGAISVAYGTSSNTAAQGNDSRITGAAQLIANGTSAMGTGAIGSGACASAVTTTATGTATTDAIIVSFNADPTAVTGYVPLTSGMLTIIGYPTANNVNWKVCNNTGSSITPGAITLNWRVVR